MTTHVVLWFWRGWRPIYTWRHVNAMVRMLRPELPANGRILCLSDQAQSSWMPAECEVAKLWPSVVPGEQVGRPNCFTRLKLFDPRTQKSLGMVPGDTIMWQDLDSLTLPGWPKLLDALKPKSVGSCLVPPYTFAAMGGLAARIHGSCIAFKGGEHSDLWKAFDPIEGPKECLQRINGHARPIGSDQAWMTRHVTGEYLWHGDDGCYSWNRHAITSRPAATANAVYWSFAGDSKPWSGLVKSLRPDLHAAYMAAYGES